MLTTFEEDVFVLPGGQPMQMLDCQSLCHCADHPFQMSSQQCSLMYNHFGGDSIGIFIAPSISPVKQVKQERLGPRQRDPYFLHVQHGAAMISGTAATRHRLAWYCKPLLTSSTWQLT